MPDGRGMLGGMADQSMGDGGRGVPGDLRGYAEAADVVMSDTSLESRPW